MNNYLAAVTEADTVENLWALHVKQMAKYGFDRLIYGYTRFRSEKSLGETQDMVVLTNHCMDYVERFVDEGLYFHAPMVRWALENDGACSWRWMQDQLSQGTLSETERRIVEFNHSMGVISGYSVSFQSVSPRAKGAIALTARAGMSQDEVDAVWKEHGQDLIVMNNVAHLKIISLPNSTARRPLTARQKEVLEWVGDGKTNQDIAQIMGLTPATVEKHLRLARLALDTDTTAQAVVKATFQNQIFVIQT